MRTTRDVSRNMLNSQSREFAEECRRQSRLIEKDPHEQDMLHWLEQAADTDGWGVLEE